MSKFAQFFAAVLVLVLIPSSSTAQQPAATAPPHIDLPHIEVPTISPRAEDVSSIDGIMKAFYEVISGPWSRDRTSTCGAAWRNSRSTPGKTS